MWRRNQTFQAAQSELIISRDLVFLQNAITETQCGKRFFISGIPGFENRKPSERRMIDCS